MGTTLEYIVQKFALNLKQRLPISIPNFDRSQLAELFNELGFKVGVEVGVQQGLYSKVLLDANPGLELYGVDPYTPYNWYGNYDRADTIGKHKAAAHKLLDPCPNYTFIENTSAEAAKGFKDSSLDFVYIDGNHDFLHVAEDLTYWSAKVKPGGIVCGDDYIERKHPTRTHVRQVVNAYTYSYDISPWFILGNERQQWLWVK